MNYELAYRIGFHPCEDAEVMPAFTEKISQLFEREQSGREPPYGQALDLGTGTFHGLNSAEREAMGREVSAIAADDATVLMLGWTPKRRGPLPRGASRSEIEAAFPGWNVSDGGATGFQAPKPIELLMRPDERWYRLRRAGATASPDAAT